MLSTTTDSYAYAVLLNELMCGRRPWLSLTRQQNHQKLKLSDALRAKLQLMVVTEHARPEPAAADEAPEGVRAVIQRCWAHKAAERMEMEEVLPVMAQQAAAGA